MNPEIRPLTPNDIHLLEDADKDLFDDPIVNSSAREFLADSRHHFVAALIDGRMIGFASAVVYVHPDKPASELWINEIGVLPEFRRRGIATDIMQELKSLALDLGCSDVWVLTEQCNEAAMSLYESLPNSRSENVVMFSFAADQDTEVHKRDP